MIDFLRVDLNECGGYAEIYPYPTSLSDMVHDEAMQNGMSVVLPELDENKNVIPGKVLQDAVPSINFDKAILALVIALTKKLVLEGNEVAVTKETILELHREDYSKLSTACSKIRNSKIKGKKKSSTTSKGI